MNLYVALVAPLENDNRVYNYGDKEEVESEAGETRANGPRHSVKASLEGAYGKRALAYMETLMQDINGGVVDRHGDALSSGMVAKFKKSAVFASASVAIQQPSAIGRALALVDPKYFLPGAAKGSWEELKRYAGTAVIKDMGRFDMSMNGTAAQWLVKRDYTLRGGKEALDAAKALVSVKDESLRDDVLGYLPGKMEEITWTKI